LYGVGARSLRRLLVLLLFSLALASVPMHAENAAATWSDDYIVVPYRGSRPKIDGMWSSASEWIDANETIFKADQSFWVLRVKQVYADIYVLIEVVSDRSIEVHDGVYLGLSRGNASSPQLGDYLFYLSLGTNALVWAIFVGDGEGWKYSKVGIEGFLCVAELSAGYSPYASDLHMTYEFKIPIGLFGASSEFRFYVEVHDGDLTFRWPEGGLKSSPSSWGRLVGFQYPDLAVTKVWVGDANGSRVFPKPGEAFYVWATVENWGVSTYMKFDADVYLDEVRLARFESLNLKRWEVANLSSQAGGVESGLHRVKWIVGDSELLDLDRENNDMSYHFQVTDQIVLVIQPSIVSTRLLQNPGFESGKLSPWYDGKRGNVTVQPDVKYDGEYAVQLAPPVGEVRLVSQPIVAACERGQTLTVSAMMKADENIAHSYLSFQYRGADGKLIGRESKSTDFGGGYDWVERSFTATVPFGAYFFDVVFWFVSSSEGPGYGYVDDVYLIRSQAWLQGLKILIRLDGESYKAADSNEVSLVLSSGIHTIETESVLDVKSGVRILFDEWDDGVRSNQRTMTIEKTTVLKPQYRYQYYLTVHSGEGNVSGEGWCDEGSVASVIAESPVLSSDEKTRMVFSGWTGDLNSTSKKVSIRMIAPRKIKAIWNTQYFLEVISPYSKVEGGGWYNVSSVANFSVASPSVFGQFGVRYHFEGWTGDWRGASLAGSILMDAPHRVVALWRIDYIIPFTMAIALVSAVVGSFSYARFIRRLPVEKIIRTGLGLSFEILLVTYLLLLLVETIWPKSIEPYVGMNYTLIAVIVFGVLTILLTRREEKPEPSKIAKTRRDYAIAFAAGIAGSVVIWYSLKGLGWLSNLISLLGGALIIVLSISLFKESKTKG